MFPKKERTKRELDSLVHTLAWNDAFGCFTRAGFEKMIWPEIADEARWIIYFDLDNVHALNEKYGGYDHVDAMVRNTLTILRLTDYVAGQWKSGDEFLICLTASDEESKGSQRESLNPQRMMERLMQELNKQGMSATFAIVPVISRDLATNMKPAIDQVYAGKKNNPRVSR